MHLGIHAWVCHCHRPLGTSCPRWTSRISDQERSHPCVHQQGKWARNKKTATPGAQKDSLRPSMRQPIQQVEHPSGSGRSRPGSSRRTSPSKQHEGTTDSLHVGAVGAPTTFEETAPWIGHRRWWLAVDTEWSTLEEQLGTNEKRWPKTQEIIKSQWEERTTLGKWAGARGKGVS
jgi:hypothetical protein